VNSRLVNAASAAIFAEMAVFEDLANDRVSF